MLKYTLDGVTQIMHVLLDGGANAIGKLAANAGVNIGAVAEALPTTFTTLQLTVGTSALQLTATVTPVKTQPIVKADPANGAGIVYLITSSGGTVATGVPLSAGDPLPVPVDDLSKLWFIASVASMKVAVVAGT